LLSGALAKFRVELSDELLRVAPVFLSFELGEKEWKIAWATSLGEKPRLKTLRARGTERLLAEIEKARIAVGARRVVSCYEAGRDGFWLHRFLHAHGIENRIVDSASIEVNRRARRQKTDRLDAEKLWAALPGTPLHALVSCSALLGGVSVQTGYMGNTTVRVHG
jgi:hypothetical protein